MADDLLLGKFLHDDGHYVDRNSPHLITMAPTRKGKGQCHVIPNLWRYGGSVLCLDVKGENIEACLPEREAATPGRVLRFDPMNPELSAHYNPLDFINRDPLDLWEECRSLATLLLVPEPGQYFAGKGRDLVTAAIQYVILDPEQPATMRQVCRVLWAGMDAAEGEDPALIRHFDRMRELGDEFLSEAADAFQGMAEREFSAVINTAQASLEPWRSPRITAVTAETSPGWSLDEIRTVPTSIFLCVPPRRVLQYASVLRVIIGQHVEALMHDAMEPLQPPFLFMLDEFPLLRYMESLETALKVGSGYGLKLWLFCQDMGQLRQNWPNPEGILSACQLKAFMNVNDPATEKYVLSLLPSSPGGGMFGKQEKARRLVEPGELFGPDYEDKILVLKDNVPPALLEKVMAFRIKPERFRRAG